MKNLNHLLAKIKRRVGKRYIIISNMARSITYTVAVALPSMLACVGRAASGQWEEFETVLYVRRTPML